MCRLVRATCWSLIATGAFVLYFLVYQLVGTNGITEQAQADLRNDLVRQQPARARAQPAAEAARRSAHPVALGQGLALIQIPKIGLDKVLVEEVRREDLRKGPGHTPHTALPGQPGTFAVSGHRTTYGAPFDDLDRLAPGDTVRIQTTTAIYTYTVTRSIVVFPRDTWVLNDVRGADGKLKATIVLTTCTPRYSARQRLVVFGELASSMTLADPTT